MKVVYAIAVSLLLGVHLPGPAGAQDDKTVPYAYEPEAIEAMSLLGKPLKRPAFDQQTAARLTEDMRQAQYRFEEDRNVDNLIWLGRRLAYRWQYRASIVLYSKGLRSFPDDPRLYRHRGHRYITVRQFDNAIADLEKAAAMIEGTEDHVEPDGQPNAAGIPTSTLHTNVWYHLGLAYYLTGDFDKALSAYEKCLAASKNNDMRVATLDWMYMALRRLGRDDDADAAIADITADMEILENHAYHRRLLMYKGQLSPAELLGNVEGENRDLDLATYGYGVGNWYLVSGDSARAKQTFEQVIEGEYWAAFGYIAAEAELARMMKE